MRLQGDGDVLEMESLPLSSDELAGFSADAALPVTLRISARVGLFRGACESRVRASSWRAFLVQLAEVEEHRHGEATLGEMQPDLFWLRVFVSDALGHTAVEGSLPQWARVGEVRVGGALSFQMQFEPDQLTQALRELRSFAGPHR